EAHVALARWLSETYLAPLWECVAVSLPPGYGQKSVTMVSPVEIPALLPIYPKDHKILAFVGAHGRVTLDALRESVGSVSMSTLDRLQRDGHLTVAQGLARPAGRPKTERRVRLLRPASEAFTEAHELARGGKRVLARVLTLLGDQPDVRLKEVRGAGATPSHLRTLAEGGWVDEYEARVVRDPVGVRAFREMQPLRLTGDQQRAADAIWERPGETALVHGVTGSGKTEVYLDLVRRTLEAGKGAILLVPEISLTPQALRRYGERFGEELAIVHSQLGTGELYDQWFRIQRGEARVVLGSRSALFAPVQNLGLVVIDEEHEWTYKQTDPQPRYHARDAAEELRRLTGATVVLGSATPDIVTYHRTETGAATRVELNQRVSPDESGGTRPGAMPDIAVVDMRQELKAGNRSVFSVPLKRAVNGALRAGEQTILFVNRRGSARFLLCRDCGYVPLCPSCEVAMSLDLADELNPRIVCHHCGRAKKLDERCPRCDSRKYRPFGVGTQRIEQEARLAFPGARVARWDSDMASRKGSHGRMVGALEAREIDIVVGTQMLAKGLDLPQMMVVGVVDADVGLNLPDYHAHERAFQLLSQVAGRAGRRDKPGQVFFQTYDPEAAPIACAAAHDYRSFYEHELAHRRRAGYPPFNRLVRLVYRHRSQEHGLKEASRVAQELRLKRDAAGRAEPDILGPQPAYITRLRGEYRWQILMRGRQPSALAAEMRFGEGWTVDVDPAGLL
ncbi:MAG: primosomal protein N', partial [Dehalococcoidia bacterium]